MASLDFALRPWPAVADQFGFDEPTSMLRLSIPNGDCHLDLPWRAQRAGQDRSSPTRACRSALHRLVVGVDAVMDEVVQPMFRVREVGRGISFQFGLDVETHPATRSSA